MIVGSCGKAVRRRVRGCYGESSACGRAAARRACGILLVVVLLLPGSLSAADANGLPAATEDTVRSARVAGRATVVDGRTLWLSGPRILVRLSNIDTCDLPQWSFDPHAATAGPSPAPVPCGALAMAWLKRLVGDRRVTCRLDPGSTGTVHVGVCRVGSVDLGREMLRVGWARRAAGGASRRSRRAITGRRRAPWDLGDLCPRHGGMAKEGDRPHAWPPARRRLEPSLHAPAGNLAGLSGRPPTAAAPRSLIRPSHSAIRR
mgnify:CR=1 FL=1